MARKRPKGVIQMGWAAIEAAAKGRTEHAPTSADYPDHVVRRTSFVAVAGTERFLIGLRVAKATTPVRFGRPRGGRRARSLRDAGSTPLSAIASPRFAAC